MSNLAESGFAQNTPPYDPAALAGIILDRRRSNARA
jgi:hypothetical protein